MNCSHCGIDSLEAFCSLDCVNADYRFWNVVDEESHTLEVAQWHQEEWRAGII